MSTQTVNTTTTQRLAPFQEDYLANIFAEADLLADVQQPFEKQQVAGLSGGQLQAIQQAFGHRSDLYARAMRDFADQAFKRQPRGFALHDPLAVAAAIMPEVVRTERVPLQVVTGTGIAAGMSLEDARTFARLNQRNT